MELRFVRMEFVGLEWIRNPNKLTKGHVVLGPIGENGISPMEPVEFWILTECDFALRVEKKEPRFVSMELVGLEKIRNPKKLTKGLAVLGQIGENGINPMEPVEFWILAECDYVLRVVKMAPKFVSMEPVGLEKIRNRKQLIKVLAVPGQIGVNGIPFLKHVEKWIQADLDIVLKVENQGQKSVTLIYVKMARIRRPKRLTWVLAVPGQTGMNGIPFMKHAESWRQADPGLALRVDKKRQKFVNIILVELVMKRKQKRLIKGLAVHGQNGENGINLERLVGFPC